MENIEAMLCAYIEGDLDAAGRAQIEKHLEANAQHRKLLEELTAMREMVRGLPRARSPVDVGDSLRQKAERTMLFGETAVVIPQTGNANRWPQLMAIAAVFLLVSSLCVILFKALSPTMKPADFSPVAVNKLPDIPAVEDASKLKDQSQTDAVRDLSAPAPMMAKASPAQETQSAPGAPAAAVAAASPTPALMQGLPATGNATPTGGLVQKTQQFASGVQQQGLAAAQVELDSVQGRLKDLGYGNGNAGQNSQAANIVLVNSNNPPATYVQMSAFLNSNSTSGVSWQKISDEDSFQFKDIRRQGQGGASAGGFGGGGGGAGGGDGAMLEQARPQANAQPMMMDKLGNAIVDRKQTPATQPSSDVYVARGLTAKQVDALRMVLSTPQSGSDVQVTVQLATTQPSLAIPSNVNALGMQNAGGATSQPAETANSAADLTSSAQSVAQTNAPTQLEAGNSTRMRLADTVIVLEPAAGNGVATASPPATRPAPTDNLAPPVQLAAPPTTQPASTQP